MTNRIYILQKGVGIGLFLKNNLCLELYLIKSLKNGRLLRLKIQRDLIENFLVVNK